MQIIYFYAEIYLNLVNILVANKYANLIIIINLIILIINVILINNLDEFDLSPTKYFLTLTWLMQSNLNFVKLLSNKVNLLC